MEIVVYGTGKECAWCVRCCEYLEQSGKEYTYKNVREDDDALEELKTQGFGSVPQVFIDGEHIGGYMELRKVSL